MGDTRDIGVCELRASYAKANITAPLTYFASKANSNGQIATPGAARPGQQVIRPIVRATARKTALNACLRHTPFRRKKRLSNSPSMSFGQTPNKLPARHGDSAM